MDDYRVAKIFSNYGIDFYCKGNRYLEEVCEEESIDLTVIENEINSIIGLPRDESIDFYSLSPDSLIDYIIEIHHQYVEKNVPVLFIQLENLCKVYGEIYPELIEINTLFMISGGELLNHLQKEETVLFPFVKTMINAIKNHETIFQPQFGTVENPILILKNDHDMEGNLFSKISKLTNNYTPPKDVSESFKSTYILLKDFEENLHIHIHLENNILFQKAAELEEMFNILD